VPSRSGWLAGSLRFDLWPNRAALEESARELSRTGVPVHTQIADVTNQQMLPILLSGRKPH